MNESYEQMLLERFRSLARDAADPDWTEVQDLASTLRSGAAGAPPPGRARRSLLIAAVAAIAVVVAVPALGLPQRMVNLFESGERAPAKTERLFSTLDRGAPPGLETHVIPGTARKALTAALPEGATATLWLAPTSKGGYCELIDLFRADGVSRGGAGPGCSGGDGEPGFGMIAPGPVSREGVLEGPLVVHGHVRDKAAVAARIRFENGTSVDRPLTWISEPIDAGFFVFGVSPSNWRAGQLPLDAQFVDANGDAVGRRVELGLLKVMAGQGGTTP
jgi:AcrR family transcriptional regulator